jgi:hypothetical protein
MLVVMGFSAFTLFIAYRVYVFFRDPIDPMEVELEDFDPQEVMDLDDLRENDIFRPYQSPWSPDSDEHPPSPIRECINHLSRASQTEPEIIAEPFLQFPSPSTSREGHDPDDRGECLAGELSPSIGMLKTCDPYFFMS